MPKPTKNEKRDARLAARFHGRPQEYDSITAIACAAVRIPYVKRQVGGWHNTRDKDGNPTLETHRTGRESWDVEDFSCALGRQIESANAMPGTTRANGRPL